MVMHARKYPRLNDGYFERGQGHSYEDKTPSRSRSSKYGDCKDSPSYTRHRDDSPTRPSPRYQNKSSYSERDKERFGKSCSDSPGDKRANHSSGSSHRSAHKNGKGRDQRDKDHKSEIQKSASQVCGDWSEHRSSSGKKYYYNCKTEVSQWEKPKDWLDPQRFETTRRDGREKSKGPDDRHKHSMVDKYSQAKPIERSLSGSSYSSSEKQRQSLPTSQKFSQQKLRHSNHDGLLRMPSQKDSRSNSTSKSEVRTELSPQYRDRHVERDKLPVLNKQTSRNSSLSNSTDGQSHRRLVHVLSRGALHDGSRQAEDMDISPGSTPTEESMSEKLHPYLSNLAASSCSTSSSLPITSSANSVLGAVAALPNLLNQLGDSTLQRSNSQQLTNQAIQTLQKLQEALIVQQRQQQQQLVQMIQQQVSQQDTPPPANQPEEQPTLQQNGSQSPESEGTPLQSPELNLPESECARPHRIGVDERSPRSEEQSKSSRRNSPTPSQNSVLGTSQLVATALKKPDTIELPASLANHYEERLTQHVSSWMEEGRTLERAADRFSEEAHNIGDMASAQVSADLKRARSWVRVTEIQSTLQEQRILFLRQQIKDLENLRSQNTFMPGDT